MQLYFTLRPPESTSILRHQGMTRERMGKHLDMDETGHNDKQTR